MIGRLMTAPPSITKQQRIEISDLLRKLDAYLSIHTELKPLVITYPKEDIDPNTDDFDK